MLIFCGLDLRYLVRTQVCRLRLVSEALQRQCIVLVVPHTELCTCFTDTNASVPRIDTRKTLPLLFMPSCITLIGGYKQALVARDSPQNPSSASVHVSL